MGLLEWLTADRFSVANLAAYVFGAWCYRRWIRPRWEVVSVTRVEKPRDDT